jgi:primary-amine oxidase
MGNRQSTIPSPINERRPSQAVLIHPLHPLQPISKYEIVRATAIAAQLARKRYGEGVAMRYKSVALHEPPKALLLPYLDAEAAGTPPDERPFVPRCLDVIWAVDNERHVTESVISMDSGTEVHREDTKYGQHASIDW